MAPRPEVAGGYRIFTGMIIPLRGWRYYWPGFPVVRAILDQRPN